MPTPGHPSSERLRRYWDKRSGSYDRQMRFFDRRLFGQSRAWVCGQATGEVLEVAIGTGLHLPLYPDGVRLTGIEFSPPVLALAHACRAASTVTSLACSFVVWATFPRRRSHFRRRCQPPPGQRRSSSVLATLRLNCGIRSYEVSSPFAHAAAAWPHGNTHPRRSTNERGIMVCGVIHRTEWLDGSGRREGVIVPASQLPGPAGVADPATTPCEGDWAQWSHG